MPSWRGWAGRHSESPGPHGSLRRQLCHGVPKLRLEEACSLVLPRHRAGRPALAGAWPLSRLWLDSQRRAEPASPQPRSAFLGRDDRQMRRSMSTTRERGAAPSTPPPGPQGGSQRPSGCLGVASFSPAMVTEDRHRQGCRRGATVSVPGQPGDFMSVRACQEKRSGDAVASRNSAAPRARGRGGRANGTVSDTRRIHHERARIN